ncbi:MAG: DUF1573 domain-containing protein, partial [Capsulimonas sp.]|uniref:DUF1573 domain-containing protein n=1 Tax=Capsulimonas sp. TaxID=2494211 RepID=UPI003267C294
PGVAIHDFGTLSLARTEPIQYDFAVKNDTGAALTLDHIQAACSCTAAMTDGVLPGEEIAAGKTLKIHVAVDPTHLGSGPANKMVWVYLKGQPSPAATLQMVGTITPLLSFNPMLLDFGPVGAGQEKSLTLRVTGEPKLLETLTIPTLTPANPSVTFVREKGIQPDKDGLSTIEYQVVVGKQARIGQLQGTVTFAGPQSDSNRLASAYASLVGEVAGEISAAPSTVALGSVPGGKRAQQEIMVTGPRKVLTKCSVRSASPYVSAKLKISPQVVSLVGTFSYPTPPFVPTPKLVNAMNVPDAEIQAMLEVTVSEKTPAGVLQTEIVVTTPSGQQLALPVWAFIEAKTVGG